MVEDAHLPVRLTALPRATRYIVHGDDESLGMLLPDTCRAIVDGDHTVLWLGPDEFMLLAPACDIPGAVDISHRDTAVEVSGSRAALVINAFCALDLDQSVFPVGMCTRTVFGKAQILLWRTAGETFRLDVARSFAPYVWACLGEARREFLDEPPAC